MPNRNPTPTSGEQHLRQTIAHLGRTTQARGDSPRRGGAAPEPLRLEPTNPFEVAVAEQLRHLRCEVDRLHGRFNWLLTVIVGAALTNIVIAVLK